VAAESVQFYTGRQLFSVMQRIGDSDVGAMFIAIVLLLIKNHGPSDDSLSAAGVTITSGGARLPNGGITLTGN
jgi:hypothetical protein